MLGKSISRADINDDVKKYVELQNEIIPLLNDQISREAQNFYEAKEISFLFEKQGLDDLFAANPSADVLRVYLASHADGTPSVILIAAMLADPKNEAAGVINLIASDANAGYQWPSRMLMQADDPNNFDITTDNG
jgi:hypothetical protein